MSYLLFAFHNWNENRRVVRMREKQMVKELKRKQNELQEWFKNNITKKKGFDYRGVWIKVNCRCGFEFTTPFYISDNGKCPECKKSFIRAKK